MRALETELAAYGMNHNIRDMVTMTRRLIAIEQTQFGNFLDYDIREISDDQIMDFAKTVKGRELYHFITAHKLKCFAVPNSRPLGIGATPLLMLGYLVRRNEKDFMRFAKLLVEGRGLADSPVRQLHTYFQSKKESRRKAGRRGIDLNQKQITGAIFRAWNCFVDGNKSTSFSISDSFPRTLLKRKAG